MVKILGVSGSPIKNSNTDRLVKSILKLTKLESEFIKLSDHKIEPCNECQIKTTEWGSVYPCQLNNQCIIQDDFQKIRSKLLETDALVIGGYATYGSINARTKTFLERLFSLDHTPFQEKPLMKSKLGVAIALCNTESSGIKAADHIEVIFQCLGMIPIAKIVAQGSFPCKFVKQCYTRKTLPIPVDHSAIRDPLDNEEVKTRLKSVAKEVGEIISLRRKLGMRI